jgi:hypothetical protein
METALMPLFLETYTVPSDIHAQDIVRAMKKVDRGSAVSVLRGGYNLTEGKAWCASEAESVEEIRRGFLTIEVPFTLDQVAPVGSATMIDVIAQPDGIFDLTP